MADLASESYCLALSIINSTINILDLQLVAYLSVCNLMIYSSPSNLPTQNDTLDDIKSR